MRRVIIAGLVGFVLAAIVAVDGWLPGGPHLPDSLQNLLSTVGLLILVPAGIWQTMVLKAGRPGRVPLSQYWSVLRTLPVWMLVGLGVLLVAAVANFILSFSGFAGYEADRHVQFQIFFRGFAGNVAWIGISIAATAYALQRMGKTTTPLDRIEEFRRRFWP